MVKPDWLHVDPPVGSGNENVNVGAQEHTGRTNRSGTITFKAAGVSDASVSLTQTAKAEFVQIADISVQKEGGSVTITGKSNSAKLNFKLGAGELFISLPSSYLAGGINTANNVYIAGDPGADAEYDFSLTFNAPENTSTETKRREIIVRTEGGQSARSIISQVPY